MPQGEAIKMTEWIEGSHFVVRVEVDAILPDEDPSEPCYSRETVQFLEKVQSLADEGNIDELSKHGEVYVRRSA